MSPAPSLFLALALTACATGSATRARQVQGAQGPERTAATVHTTERAASRLGPPSARGLSLRRVDRPSRAEPPIALK
ncbi:MAG: hypothetical protein ABUL62_27020 [Myxococcales bacterium]|jgi:hypothetical protein